MMLTWAECFGRWHLAKTRVGETTTMRCGGVFVIEGELVEESDDGMPPHPCSGCLVDWGMEQARDEPFDVALRRGYVPDRP